MFMEIRETRMYVWIPVKIKHGTLTEWERTDG